MAKKMPKKPMKKAAKKVAKKTSKKKVSKKKPQGKFRELGNNTSDIEFEARHGLDTLIRAERIKGDKKLMKAIEAEKKKRQDALNSISKE